MPPRTPFHVPTERATLLRRSAALAFLLFTATGWAADRMPNQACLDCHEAAAPDKKDKDADSNPAVEILRARAVLEIGARKAPLRRLPRLGHGLSPTTTSCRPPMRLLPQPSRAAYASSIHGMSHARGPPAPPPCADCHGATISFLSRTPIRPSSSSTCRPPAPNATAIPG